MIGLKFNYSEHDHGGSRVIWSNEKRVSIMGEDWGQYTNASVVPNEASWNEFGRVLDDLDIWHLHKDEVPSDPRGYAWSFYAALEDRTVELSGVHRPEIFLSRKPLAAWPIHLKIVHAIGILTGWKLI